MARSPDEKQREGTPEPEAASARRGDAGPGEGVATAPELPPLAQEAEPQLPDGEPPARVPRISTFAALGYRDFRYLWFGQIAHAASLWMEQVARALLVLDLTGNSATQLGLILAIRIAPTFSVGLFAGVLADWYNRRTILLIAKAGSAASNAALALLILSAQYDLPLIPPVAMWHVYVTTLIKGAFTALDQPARTSLIPSLVPINQVTNAIAVNSSTQNTMRILGATLGGVLVAAVGAGWTFVVITGIFLLAIYFTLRLRVPPQPRVERRTAAAAVSSFKEGLAYAWSTPAIKWVVVLAMVFYSFGITYSQLFVPLFAKTVLELGDAGVGYMMATVGGGALMAALILATLNPHTRRGVIMMGVMLFFGSMLILFSLSTYLGFLPLTFVLLAFVGAGQTTYFALQNSVLLTHAPDEMRGRIMALLAQDRALLLVGAATGGFLADAVGVAVAQIMFGAACVIGVLAMAAFAPALRKVQ